MSFLDNFLTSGHSFSLDENLIKFRFSFLNALLSFSIFVASLAYFSYIFKLFEINIIFQNMTLVFILINTYFIYFLRIKKENLAISAHILITVGLILFYFALFTIPNDEFRLIWFFIIVFTGFILIGRIYGLILTILVVVSILSINYYIDIKYSSMAMFTFTISFFIFASFSYFFLNKIEKDALEFELLNNKLKEKVSKEVQQRQEQEQMFLHQSRLAGMGEMIDSIAHQWRQPLMNINAILMNMDRAIETKNKTPQYMEEKMDEVITLTTHMSQTIEDFRSLFKTDKEKISFNVFESIEQCVALFKSTLKDIKVDFKCKQELHFYGHLNELIQVIIILLSNAIEALNSRNIDDKTIHISLEEKKTMLVISIEDNAGGIKKEHFNTIFEPYFTTKEVGGGTGLGLYIAKIIIEQNMQGTLSVSNTKKGAKFKISLPKS